MKISEKISTNDDNFVLSVTQESRAAQEPFLDEAAAMFRQNGCLILKGAIEKDLVDEAHRAFESVYGDWSLAEMEERSEAEGRSQLLQVGHRRFEVAPMMEDGLGNRELFGSEMILGVLDRLLGPGYKLNSATIVTSYPGADWQHLHRDYVYLYGDDVSSKLLPPHAVNVSLPLIDVTPQMGLTAVWPGSHKWPGSAQEEDGLEEVVRSAARWEPIGRGDAVFIDFRTLHAGMPNRGVKRRPILYLVYARPWFFDEVNHLTRNPIMFPLEAREELPVNLRNMLSRAWAFHEKFERHNENDDDDDDDGGDDDYDNRGENEYPVDEEDEGDAEQGEGDL